MDWIMYWVGVIELEVNVFVVVCFLGCMLDGMPLMTEKSLGLVGLDISGKVVSHIGRAGIPRAGIPMGFTGE